MSILLEAEHLTKSIYPERKKIPFKAVNDVSFTLKKRRNAGNCRRIRQWEKYNSKAAHPAD